MPTLSPPKPSEPNPGHRLELHLKRQQELLDFAKNRRAAFAASGTLLQLAIAAKGFAVILEADDAATTLHVAIYACVLLGVVLFTVLVLLRTYANAYRRRNHLITWILGELQMDSRKFVGVGPKGGPITNDPDEGQEIFWTVGLSQTLLFLVLIGGLIAAVYEL